MGVRGVQTPSHLHLNPRMAAKINGNYGQNWSDVKRTLGGSPKNDRLKGRGKGFQLSLTNQQTISIQASKELLTELWHGISNNVVCATSNVSDQPTHTRSLIRA